MRHSKRANGSPAWRRSTTPGRSATWRPAEVIDTIEHKGLLFRAVCEGLPTAHPKDAPCANCIDLSMRRSYPRWGGDMIPWKGNTTRKHKRSTSLRSGQPSLFLVRGSPESRYELVRLLPHWDTVHLSVYEWNKTCFKEVTCCLSLLGPHGQFAYLSPSLLGSCSHSRQPSLPLPMSTSSSSAAIR